MPVGNKKFRTKAIFVFFFKYIIDVGIEYMLSLESQLRYGF